MYASLAFFDLETTDLPHRNPSITEIAFTACSWEHFQRLYTGGPDDILPRVLHKLTLCLNPMRAIPPVVRGITGLDNFMLRNENPFRSSVGLINQFIENLQQPVLLIAHNGATFDFPLLAQKLNECNSMLNVDCVDSMSIFRKIYKDLRALTEAEELRALQALLNPPPPTPVEEFDQVEIIMAPESPEIFFGDNLADFIDDNLLASLTQEAEQKFVIATSPLKEDNSKQPQKKKTGKITKPKPPPKPKRPKVPMPSFKLSAIYERCFGVVPEKAHRAEEDTILLMKCARYHAKAFLDNIPGNTRSLESFLKGNSKKV